MTGSCRVRTNCLNDSSVGGCRRTGDHKSPTLFLRTRAVLGGREEVAEEVMHIPAAERFDGARQSMRWVESNWTRACRIFAVTYGGDTAGAQCARGLVCSSPHGADHRRMARRPRPQLETTGGRRTYSYYFSVQVLRPPMAYYRSSQLWKAAEAHGSPEFSQCISWGDFSWW